MQEGQLYEQRWGAYNLPTTYDHILVTSSSSMSRDHMPDETSQLGSFFVSGWSYQSKQKYPKINTGKRLGETCKHM